VYGVPDQLPLREDAPLRAHNPYGATKLMIEDILRELATHQPDWNISLLRYFNPVGAHHSGLIGEDPNGIPNNLMPNIQQVAVGRREHVSVWGNDYPTRDGTGVRDYIHVTDLAIGHLHALRSRPGDIAETWADPGKAKSELGWIAQRDLAAMCADAWNWQQRNPDGYP
ncbi:MAG TPA: GDP-mannose 4,6-dehydratase, partial [Xanthomonadales bacterium]|nr:GDP-mannose 4,6-dehydratase [Xanthomonadales bacterium]